MAQRNAAVLREVLTEKRLHVLDKGLEIRTPLDTAGRRFSKLHDFLAFIRRGDAVRELEIDRDRAEYAEAALEVRRSIPIRFKGTVIGYIALVEAPNAVVRLFLGYVSLAPAGDTVLEAMYPNNEVARELAFAWRDGRDVRDAFPYDVGGTTKGIIFLLSDSRSSADGIPYGNSRDGYVA